MEHKLTTIEEAETILQLFNYFHDGFIKRLTFISRDKIEPAGGRLYTGEADIEMQIAFFGPVEARFYDIEDFSMDDREVSIDADILELTVIATERESHIGEWKDGRLSVVARSVPCFAVKLTQTTYDYEQQRWMSSERQLFTFKEAHFIGDPEAGRRQVCTRL